MTHFDEQYYIAAMPPGEDQIFAKPDKKTASRRFRYKKTAEGEAPFFFFNSNAESDKEKGNQWPVTEILVVDANLLIGKKIHDELVRYEINGLQMNPSIYVDDIGNRHENYWFLTFYEGFEFMDKTNSVLEEDEDYADLEVLRYSLDHDKLQGIPEENRLLFKMKGASVSYIFVHQKFVDFITKNNVEGIRFFKVSEFREGTSFRI